MHVCLSMERLNWANLWTGQLFVLLPLGHFDWRQVGDSRDQEVHEDVFAVGGAIHQSPQGLGQVVCEQVVVVPAVWDGALYSCVRTAIGIHCRNIYLQDFLKKSKLSFNTFEGKQQSRAMRKLKQLIK